MNPDCENCKAPEPLYDDDDAKVLWVKTFLRDFKLNACTRCMFLRMDNDKKYRRLTGLLSDYVFDNNVVSFAQIYTSAMKCVNWESIDYDTKTKIMSTLLGAKDK
jgi:hypothetical protein